MVRNFQTEEHSYFLLSSLNEQYTQCTIWSAVAARSLVHWTATGQLSENVVLYMYMYMYMYSRSTGVYMYKSFVFCHETEIIAQDDIFLQVHSTSVNNYST